MEMKKRLGIHIEGCIYAVDEHVDIDHDEFLDKFIDFVEANGWMFGGGTYQVDEDGEAVK
jgi:uncharacterized protein YggL (DUF469 family)